MATDNYILITFLASRSKVKIQKKLIINKKNPIGYYGVQLKTKKTPTFIWQNSFNVFINNKWKINHISDTLKQGHVYHCGAPALPLTTLLLKTPTAANVNISSLIWDFSWPAIQNLLYHYFTFENTPNIFTVVQSNKLQSLSNVLVYFYLLYLYLYF